MRKAMDSGETVYSKAKKKNGGDFSEKSGPIRLSEFNQKSPWGKENGNAPER